MLAILMPRKNGTIRTARIIVALLAATPLLLVGAAPCIWQTGFVIINSNNEYRLQATSPSGPPITFHIQSQCRIRVDYDGSGGASVLSRSVALIGYRGQDTEARIEVFNGNRMIDSFVIAPPTNQNPIRMAGRVATQPNGPYTTEATPSPVRLTFPAMLFESQGFPQAPRVIQGSSGAGIGGFNLYCDTSYGGRGATLQGRWDRNVREYATTQLNVTTNALPTTFTFNPAAKGAANSFPEFNLLVNALTVFNQRNVAYRGYNLQLGTLQTNPPPTPAGGGGYTATLGYTKYQFQMNRAREGPCPPSGP